MRATRDGAAGNAAITRIAARQHGVFGRQQALRAGMSAAQLTHRCRAGICERVEPRVYRLAGSPATWHQRLIELDGWSAHGTRPAFHADRRRQNALVLAGWTLLRFTWADLVDSPAAVVAAVHGALAA